MICLIRPFGLKGLVASIEGINGQAMTDLGLGSEIAITLAGIFIVNIILARITPFKYIFLTGQALLWESTLCVVFAYFCGLRGLPLIIVGSIVGGAFATLNASICTASYAADYRYVMISH